MALNGIPLNGQTIDRTDVHPEVHPADHGEDVDMGTETTEERRRRYFSSSQYEVSNPDEWADVQLFIWTAMHMKECLLTPEPTGFDCNVQQLH